MDSNIKWVDAVTVDQWEEKFSPALQIEMVQTLENGKVLFFPKMPFLLDQDELRFLSPHYIRKNVKNISFDSQKNSLKGACGDPHDLAQIKMMLARFSLHATTLILNLFPHYRHSLKVARTSFRPVEITNRHLSYRKDDSRLHVDAFPSSPNQGQRILRVFSNINLQGEPRVWRLGEPFEKVARRFLPHISKPWPGSGQLLNLFRITRGCRTEYDHIMLQMHNLMKKDLAYQQQATQEKFNFPAHTTWVVQTDQVSHAAMSGQHLLEQTFYLPVEAMVNPSQSPLKILESLVGRRLV